MFKQWPRIYRRQSLYRMFKQWPRIYRRQSLYRMFKQWPRIYRRQRQDACHARTELMLLEEMPALTSSQRRARQRTELAQGQWQRATWHSKLRRFAYEVGRARIACEVAACAWAVRSFWEIRAELTRGRDTLTGAHRNVIPGASV
jgi:hypothetical protein